jgi:toxin ParE1/3/4
MSYQLKFLPEVERDVSEAYDWYEEQLEGLGEDLLLSIDASLNGIVRNPHLSEVLYKGMRKRIVKRFPFGIFYIVEENVITIISVIHLARHPKTWKKRKPRK